MSPQPAIPSFTPTQGQYLAFIYAYTCVLGRPPAEADLQRHFGVSPPSVNLGSRAVSRSSSHPKCCRSFADPSGSNRNLLRVGARLCHSSTSSLLPTDP